MLRAFVFVPGQHLFHSVKDAFGYKNPNYDVLKLAQALCAKQSWECAEVFFYTGLPREDRDALHHMFWRAKIATMGRQGIIAYTRPLRYNDRNALRGHETGIDVRIAIDLVRFTHEKAFDAALILSHDQALSEAVREVYRIAKTQQRWVTVACALPPTSAPPLYNARPLVIDRTTYDACIDPIDYLSSIGDEAMAASRVRADKRHDRNVVREAAMLAMRQAGFSGRLYEITPGPTGETAGTIVAVSAQHVAQTVNREGAFAIHEASRLDRIPDVGTLVTVRYRDGRGIVSMD